MLPLLLNVVAFLPHSSSAQEWNLKLKSKVEMRSWLLSNKAAKTERELSGTTVTLLKNDQVIKQVQSDPNGEFEIDIPGNGQYTLTLDYPGCPTKRFTVASTGVPEKAGYSRFSPQITLLSFIMGKKINGVDYIGLNNPITHVEFKSGTESFQENETVAEKGKQIEAKIVDAENHIVEKHCALNKKGDDAFKAKNYNLAKSFYEQAIAMLPEEEYAKEGLKKTKDKLEEKEAIEKEKKEAARQKAATQNIVSATKSSSVQSKSNSNSSVIVPKNSSYEKKDNIGRSKAKHSVSHTIGHNDYKEAVKDGDELFKDKRYEEAKKAFTEALSFKPGDAYAKSKVEECDKLLKK